MVTALISKGLSAQIEKDPLDPISWLTLENLVKSHQDFLSGKTLEVVVAGLQALQKKKEEAIRSGSALPDVSSMTKATFIRLAKAYNSPAGLTEIGKIYLQAWHLPLQAILHFERVRQLGGLESSLRPLLTAAELALQKEGARLKGNPEHSGVIKTAHPAPLLSSIISKSGKLAQGAHLLSPPRTGTLPKVSESEIRNIPGTSEECAVQAVQAVKEKQFTWAINLLNKANQQPLSSDRMWHAWSHLGLALFETGDFAQAENAYANASRYGPDRMTSHFNLGTARHMNGNLTGALASYHRAEALDPQHPKVWCNLGVLLCQQDNFMDAEVALRQAVKLQPDYARAWDNLGVALGAQNRLDEALEAAYRALELKPGYPEACFKIGLIQSSRNNYAEAIQALERAADLAVLTPYAHTYLALLYERQGLVGKARAMIESITALDPQFELLAQAWNGLGSAYAEKGNYSAAITAFQQACTLEPEKAEWWSDLGVALQRHDEPKQAREAFQKAVKLNFSYSVAWHNLGLACAALGRHAEATAAFQQEVRLKPDDPLAWYDLAVSLDREGLRGKAQEAYAKVDELEKAQPVRYEVI